MDKTLDVCVVTKVAPKEKWFRRDFATYHPEGHSKEVVRASVKYSRLGVRHLKPEQAAHQANSTGCV